MLIRQDLIQMIDALGGAAGITYLSVPITSGLRELAFMERTHQRSPELARLADPHGWRREVLQPNEADATRMAADLRHRLDDLVLNPAALSKGAWEQEDYHTLWLDVIERHAKRVVVAPEWAWSRGARLEVGAAIWLGRDVQGVDGRSYDTTTLEDQAENARSTLLARDWSSHEIDQVIPTMKVERPSVVASPQTQTFEWLSGERAYQIEKFGIEQDDEHTLQGLADDGWWRPQLLRYLHRARVLGLDLPVGRQALAKFAATACGLVESAIRVHGPLPPPGVSSGELEGRPE